MVSGIIFPFLSHSQTHNLPLNQSFNFHYEKAVLQSDQLIHNSFKPVLEQEAKQVEEVDSIVFPSLHQPKVARSFVSRKLFHEHFISLDTGLIQLTIDPIVNFEYGIERASTDDSRGDLIYYKNVRGFSMKLGVGKKVAFESNFRENQAVLPYYIDQRVKNTEVAYGQGRWKKFGDNGYDFSMASSYVSYSPTDRFNFQIGHGKHFLGEGHRSILLSDLSYNYPYLKINSKWGKSKLQYQNLYTVFQDLKRVQATNTEALFERKQGAFHYLEYKPTSQLTIGLFEGTLFPSLDSTGNLPIGANFWVPLIFLNSLVEEIEGGVNSIIGSNVNVVIKRKIQLYNQVAIFNKQSKELALQLGAKWYVGNCLLLQGEWNRNLQSSKSVFYSHYNESLGHPYNDGATEWMGIVQFQKKRWQTRVLASTVNQTAAGSKKVSANFVDARQSLIINPSFNFTIHVGVQYVEQEVNPVTAQLNNYSSVYTYFGISTNLQNIYFNY